MRRADARCIAPDRARAWGGCRPEYGGIHSPGTAAVFTVMIVPPIVLFVALQKWFMKGLLEGALRQ